MAKVDFSEVLDFADELDAAGGVLHRAVRRRLSQSLDVLENAIVQRTPVNTGTLRAGINKEIRSMGSILRGAVVNPVSYALPVEYGRKAGRMPPTSAIELWVVRKGIAQAGPQARQIAFAIARAIGRRGTRGAHMFRDGFDASAPAIMRLISRIPDDVIKELAS